MLKINVRHKKKILLEYGILIMDKIGEVCRERNMHEKSDNLQSLQRKNMITINVKKQNIHSEHQRNLLTIINK